MSDVFEIETTGAPLHTAKVLRELVEKAWGYGAAVILPIAEQIEAQTQPPRIPEPGKYGVVRDLGGSLWVAVGGQRFVDLDGGRSRPWADIVDPVLVREGI